jgi:hypothetical protein
MTNEKEMTNERLAQLRKQRDNGEPLDHDDMTELFDAVEFGNDFKTKVSHDFKTMFSQLDDDTKQVLFAALWAAQDVHAPVDNLTQKQWELVDSLAEFTNQQLSK